MDKIVKKSHPLSLGQQALWLIQQIAPDSVAYNIFITAKIKSDLKIPTFIKVWEQIVERHPILRTNYTAIDGKPVQQINEQQQLNIEVIDASNWSEAYLKKQIFAETDRPFNLEKDAVLRITLFSKSKKEHIFLLTIHHIVSDMLSFDLMLREFQALYGAEIGQASQKTDKDSLNKHKSYLEFVHWQSEMLSSSRGEKSWQYWHKQLAGELPILNLLPDKPRPAVKTYQGAAHLVQLEQQLTQKLQALALTLGTSLYNILLTAFYVQLYRYTNQKDLLVGSPMRGRGGGKFKNTLGCFANLVVLRASVDETLTFPEFLNQVSKQVKQAQKHQDYPFYLLVEQLQPKRDPSRSPLCQVSLVWQVQGWCEPSKNLGDTQEQVLQMEPYLSVGAGQRGADFDLTLLVKKAKEVLQLSWQYNTDLFYGDTIERMAAHFVTLLEGIVANPQQQISQLPLLTKVEQQQLLVEWNDTQADYPQDKCIHQLFEEQVKLNPNAIAIQCENQQLTYQQLNTKANQLADYLQSLGVKPDVLVGIYLERSPLMMVGLLGILKAGGAYVPLDPEYPQDRLSFMLKDTQVSLVLTQARLTERLPEPKAQMICLDRVWPQIVQNNQDNPVSGVKAFHLAYVIYTSGSTGKPKGVMVEHKGLCNLAQAQIQAFGVNCRSRVLQFASLSFDACIWEILMALGTGATLYLEPKDSIMPGKPLITRLRDCGITHITLPPSALAVMPREELPELQTIIVAGEACSAELMRQWSVGRDFFNAYGPTEATVCATVAKCTDGDPKISIGRPLANTQIYILDAQNQLVPIGVPGELHIGGVGLARGYLNRPELTDEKFISNPFEEAGGRRQEAGGRRQEAEGRRQEAGGSKLYKTGDLARYLPDGKIEFLGRIDNQVKIRGFRLELGEIDTVLSQYPQIKASVVMLQEDTPGDKRLVAYVVPEPEITPTISEIRQFLRVKLPEYMVPTAFVILEALPLTPNGKIDRRALPTPELDRELIDEFVAPRSPLEAQLAQIWSETLKIERIGVQDNFFDLGGHSLLATQVISRINSAFRLDLSIQMMFESPTVAQLTEGILGQQQRLEQMRSTVEKLQASVNDSWEDWEEIAL